MKYEYLAQDELDVIENLNSENSEIIKDPVEVTIKITLSKSKYHSKQNKYKIYIPEKVRKIFK